MPPAPLPLQLDYLQGTQDFDLPFSESFSGNMRGFCIDHDAFTSWIASIVCLRPRKAEWEPVKWRRVKHIVRDSEDWYNHMWQNKYRSCC